MKDIKDLLDKTTDLPEPLKEELVDTFNSTVSQYIQEKLNVDVNKPLDLLATDPDFKRLVIAWDRNNPETTRAQLLRSFPAAFKDLQGNTIAEPLVDFLMDILHALISDTSLMQRLIRQMDKNAAEKGEEVEEPVAESASFKFTKLMVEDKNEYMQSEEYVLNSGYKFAFFANDELMPVSPEEATHKVFVKTVTVSDSASEVEPEAGEEKPSMDGEGSEEFTFVAKKMVALEWKPEYGGVGTEEVKAAGEEEELEVPENEEEPEISEKEEELVDKVNEYLEYVTEEFIKENKVNIEAGIKMELAENLINGLRKLLSENDIMEFSKKDAVAKLEERLKMNEDAMNSIYEKNIELFKENKKLRQELFEQKVASTMKAVFEEEQFSESAQEKIKSLFKFVNLTGDETEQDIRNKIMEITESLGSFKGVSPKEKVKKLFETEKVSAIETGKPSKDQEKIQEEIIKEVLKNNF